jgi:K+-sensing histidine kinase KdpD
MTDLMDFGKMQGTQLVLDIRSINVNDVIKQVFNQVSSLLQSKNQNLSYEMNFSLPYIKADSERVVQILLNLLTNASKFSPDKANLSLRIYPTDAFLNFELLDAAPAIIPAEAKLIFTPYYRGKHARRTRGLGLGLSICKGLVEFQGGMIWMQRREGGNIFGFSFLASRHRMTVQSLVTREVSNENITG